MPADAGASPVEWEEALAALGMQPGTVATYQNAAWDDVTRAKRLTDGVPIYAAKALLLRSAALAQPGNDDDKTSPPRCGGKTVRWQAEESLVSRLPGTFPWGQPETHESLYSKVALHQRQGLQDLIYSKRAPGSMGNYNISWRQWMSFCISRGDDPLLMTGRLGNPQQAEQALFEFMAHERGVMKMAEGTIATKIYAVRYAVIAHGGDDILTRFPRVKLGLQSLKRLGAAPACKLPVTGTSFAGCATLSGWGGGVPPAIAGTQRCGRSAASRFSSCSGSRNRRQ